MNTIDSLMTTRILLAALTAGSIAIGAGQARGGNGKPLYDFIELTGLNEPLVAAMNRSSQVAGLIPGNTLFRWDDGAVITVDIPGSGVSVRDINDDGVIVANRRNDKTGLFEVVVWDPEAEHPEFYAPPMELDTFAINNDLTVAGVTFDQLSGFVFESPTQDLTILNFGDPPRRNVGTRGARDINNAGFAVGAEVIFDGNAFAERPYIWSADRGMTELPTVPPFHFGAAVKVNDNNVAVGCAFDEFFTMLPARWTDGELEIFNSPLDFFISEATAVNNLGQMTVVACNDFFGFTEAFLLEDGVYTDLTAAAPCCLGEHVARAFDINDAGDILVNITTGIFIVNRGILRPIADDVVGDLDGDGSVGTPDLVLLLGAWGPCDDCGDCLADLDGDCAVGGGDLILLLGNWG